MTASSTLEDTDQVTKNGGDSRSPDSGVVCASGPKTETDIGAIIDVDIVPALPAYVHLVEAEVDRDEPSPARIAELMSQDMGLVTRVLRLANSAIYNRSTTEVATIGDAVLRVGIREIRGICLLVALAPMFAVSDPHLNLKKLLKHSLAVALASKALIHYCPPEIRHQLSSEVLHVTGILHDIGLIVLSQQAPDAFSEVRLLCSSTDKSFADCERAVLGFSHTDISYMVLRRWNFPDLLAEVVQAHHEYNQASGKIGLHARVLHVADSICNQHGNCDNFEGLVEPYDSGAWNDLGLDSESVSYITDDIDRMMEEAEIVALLS